MAKIHFSPQPQLGVAGSSAPDPAATSLPEYHAQISQVLQSSLLSTCRCIHALELTMPGLPPGILTTPSHPTKAGDMHAFGILTFEVRIDSLNCNLSAL